MAKKHKLTRGGASTRDHIIASAKVVLHDVGFAHFSTPKVSAQAGISQGNLTYYFPNRNQLILAVVESLVTEYSDAFTRFYSQFERVSQKDLEKMVEWLIDDATTEKTARVIPELWAMSNHNADVALAMHRLYDDTACTFAESLGVSIDNPLYDDFMSAIYFLSATVEGATAIHVTRPADHDKRLQLLKRSAVPVLANLLFGIIEAAQRKHS